MRTDEMNGSRSERFLTAILLVGVLVLFGIALLLVLEGP